MMMGFELILLLGMLILGLGIAGAIAYALGWRPQVNRGQLKPAKLR